LDYNLITFKLIIYMKSKIINIFFITATMLAGCSKALDTIPTQSISESDALKTSSDVQVALVGSYSDLGASDIYGGRAFVNPDLLGDNNELIWSGTFQGMTQIFNKSIPIDNGFITNTWLTAYKTINDVNNVLSALNVVVATDKSRVEGEAKFIRGLAYFDLVRLYAKAWNDGTPANNPGVPLILTPTRSITAASKVARNKVSEVYDQVIKDLTDAEADLPATNGFFATKYSAAAILARVYLQKGDYSNAIQAANRVIMSGKYSLNGNYGDEFPFSPNGPTSISNTSEDIFAIQVNATQGVNDFNTFYSSNGRGDITIDDNHLNLYEAGDDRLNVFYDDGGSIYTGKFENAYGNVHVTRLAEMYLIRAESNFRLGTAAGATPLADVNTIRARVLLPPLVTVTLNDILKERKLELAFEGFTLHDVKRLQGTVGALPWNSPKLIYPIPDRERKVNDKLTQNEGY
jgi:starch-binding outer membrane protein, SusD/RagB family